MGYDTKDEEDDDVGAQTVPPISEVKGPWQEADEHCIPGILT